MGQTWSKTAWLVMWRLEMGVTSKTTTVKAPRRRIHRRMHRCLFHASILHTLGTYFLVLTRHTYLLRTDSTHNTTASSSTLRMHTKLLPFTTRKGMLAQQTLCTIMALVITALHKATTGPVRTVRAHVFSHTRNITDRQAHTRMGVLNIREAAQSTAETTRMSTTCHRDRQAHTRMGVRNLRESTQSTAETSRMPTTCHHTARNPTIRTATDENLFGTNCHTLRTSFAWDAILSSVIILSFETLWGLNLARWVKLLQDFALFTCLIAVVSCGYPNIRLRSSHILSGSLNIACGSYFLWCISFLWFSKFSIQNFRSQFNIGATQLGILFIPISRAQLLYKLYFENTNDLSTRD